MEPFSLLLWNHILHCENRFIPEFTKSSTEHNNFLHNTQLLVIQVSKKKVLFCEQWMVCISSYAFASFYVCYISFLNITTFEVIHSYDKHYNECVWYIAIYFSNIFNYSTFILTPLNRNLKVIVLLCSVYSMPSVNIAFEYTSFQNGNPICYLTHSTNRVVFHECLPIKLYLWTATKIHWY